MLENWALLFLSVFFFKISISKSILLPVSQLLSLCCSRTEDRNRPTHSSIKNQQDKTLSGRRMQFSCDHVSVHWRKEESFPLGAFENYAVQLILHLQEPRKCLTSNMVNCITPITNIIIFDSFEKLFWEYCAYLNHFIYYLKESILHHFQKIKNIRKKHVSQTYPFLI